MFGIEKPEVILSNDLNLKDDVPLCESCMFGTSTRTQRRTKGDKSGSARGGNGNKPGAAVSVDQIQSAQPGLVPEVPVKLISALIWAAQVMVDQFIGLTYLHLIISTSQEENRLGKADFEIWSAIFLVKINRYHEENGRFSEQPFRSEIEDSKLTIKFCGVGSHHQNAIFERKIQTLTLGSGIFLVHAKVYCPEEITTILCTYVPKNFSETLNEVKVDDNGNTPMEKFAGRIKDINL